MRADVKEDIMMVAKQLFNERGYNEVSMRDIAAELQISVGNLTYHFKKKEDLVEAVILKQHEGYKKKPTPESLDELYLFFQRMLLHEKENSYYFRHYKQLSQLSPKVYAIQRKVLGDFTDTLLKSFTILKTKQLLKDDEIPNQSVLAIEAIMSVCIFGLVQNKQNRFDCIWSLIYPLLTPRGAAIYQALKY